MRTRRWVLVASDRAFESLVLIVLWMTVEVLLDRLGEFHEGRDPTSLRPSQPGGEERLAPGVP